MMKLTTFKNQLYDVFRFLKATEASYVDVSYKGQLYRIHVEDMHERVKQVYKRRDNLVNNIEAKKCPDCKKLMLSGVCMNSMCPGKIV